MKAKVLVLFLAIPLLFPGLISAQNTVDPIIGTWSTMAGGYSWSIIIKRANENTADGTLIGILDRPLSLFKTGEEFLIIHPTSAPGIYEGEQKWKNVFRMKFWRPARLVMSELNVVTQENSVNFKTLIPTTWVYTRTSVPPEIPKSFPSPSSGSSQSVSAGPKSGSGFLLKGTQLIVTNNHVIQDCSKVKVILQGKEYPAEVKRQDKRNDLAILSLPTFTPNGESGLDLDLQFHAHPGQSIFVIGYPLSYILGHEASIADGIINSTLGPDDDPTLFRISAVLNPGNSGGPIIDNNGMVIGIVVAKLRPEFGEGVSFGIKMATASPILSDTGYVAVEKTETALSAEDIFKRAAPWVVYITAE